MFVRRAFQDSAAICITSWSIITLCGYAAAVVSFLVSVEWREKLRWNLVREHLTRALARCRATLLARRRGGESPVDAAVHVLVQQRNKEFIRRALFHMAPLFAVTNVFELLDPLNYIGHPGESHVIATAVVPGLAALSLFREDQPGKAVMVVAHVMGFLSLVLGLQYYPHGRALEFDRPTVLGVRLAFSMTACDIRLTMLCNAVYGSLMIYRLHEFVSIGDEDATFRFATLVHQELSAIVGLVVLHSVFVWRLERWARGTVEAKMSAHFIGGLKKLLRTSYDVVVELTDDLAFADDSHDLAGALLYGPDRSLKGSHITDLMPSDVDKKAFSEHVRQGLFDAESQCRVFPGNFHMRDSCSNLLRMEMWHTRFEDLDSRSRHLIGIKELANHEQAPAPQGNSPRPTIVQSTNSGRRRYGTARQRRSGPREASSQTQVSDDDQPRQGHIVEDARQPDAEEEQEEPQDHANRMRDGEDSDGSTKSSTSRRSRRCVIEGFKRTSAQAQKASIMHIMKSWNVAMSSAGCCADHQILNEIIKTAKWLASRPCRKHDLCERQAKLWQCSNCGILVAADEPVMRICHLCNLDNSGTCTVYGL